MHSIELVHMKLIYDRQIDKLPYSIFFAAKRASE